MMLRFLLRQAAFVDEALHEVWSSVNCCMATVAQSICTRVADLCHADSAAIPKDCGQRRAHALELFA